MRCCPARQLGGGAEPTDVADLGAEHRCQHRTDPGELLERGIAGIGDQPATSQTLEQLDLGFQVLDQTSQGLHPRRVRAGQRAPGRAGRCPGR
jgi:hypothetical protein